MLPLPPRRRQASAAAASRHRHTATSAAKLLPPSCRRRRSTVFFPSQLKSQQTKRIHRPLFFWEGAPCPGTDVFRPWAAVERPWLTTPMVSMMVKIAKLRFVKKGTKKRSDVELWRESA
jgi:hypothetical protein